MLFFVGCSQKMPEPIVRTVTVTKVVVQKQKVPEGLLVIQSLPKVPTDIKLQSQVAQYITDLYSVAKSCTEDKKNIKQWNKGK